MTKKILLCLSKRSPEGDVYTINRVFNDTDEACTYLTEMTSSNSLKYLDDTFCKAKMSNKWTLKSNYSLRKILCRKPVDKELSSTYPFILKTHKERK